MTFKIIDNSSPSGNHLTRLKDLFNKSDSVVLTSPFLMTDFADFLGEVSISDTKKIHLITTLKPKSFDQIRKVSSLVSLIEFPDIQEGRVKCQISLNNKLHGKIYIFKKAGEYLSAIVSSANFTDSGLSKNHEWGIEIMDKNEIAELEKSILDCLEFENLSFEDIYAMQESTNDFLANQPQAEERDIDLNLTDLLASPNWTTELDDTITYWLKPIGVTDSPVEEGRLFTELDTMLNFSKLRPNGVTPNNILIAYGVGSTKILAIYRVTSFPEHVTLEQIQETDWFERWPWYVTGHNLTPNFGGTWWTHNLYINTLKDQYLTANPDNPITAVGGQTLGALNFGKDKLKLSHDFARYIIDQVVEINDRQ